MAVMILMAFAGRLLFLALFIGGVWVALCDQHVAAREDCNALHA
jgi:hypothetical protein